MPATAAMTPPVDVVLRMEEVTPVRPRVVVVALVVDAFVAKSEVNILCAPHVFEVVVPNAKEMVFEERVKG